MDPSRPPCQPAACPPGAPPVQPRTLVLSSGISSITPRVASGGSLRSGAGAPSASAPCCGNCSQLRSVLKQHALELLGIPFLALVAMLVLFLFLVLLASKLSADSSRTALLSAATAVASTFSQVCR